MKRPQRLRCYVASKFENVGPVRDIQLLCRDAGLEITCDWTTDGGGPTSMPREIWEAQQRRGALEDFQGVCTADLFILVLHPGMKGAFVELGIALAQGLDVWVVGDRSIADNVFFYLQGNDNKPLIEFFPTIDQMNVRLTDYAKKRK